jgi:hypothetical protein
LKPETAIQIQIVNRLSQLAWENGFFYFSIPNEGFMQSAVGEREGPDRKYAARLIYPLLASLKKMGLTPGVPDLCVVREGRAYFLEVKTETGRASGVQNTVHARILYCGCPVRIVRSVEDAEETLKEWVVIG